MQIAERTIGDVTVLDLTGRLVAGDGDDVLRDAVDRLVQAGCRKLLLNLQNVPYIDSGGLSALVSKYVTLRRRDGQLRVCSLTPRTAHVLEITRLLTVFGSFASEAEGVKSFSSQ
jgi:anti-anti-sigma factor